MQHTPCPVALLHVLQQHRSGSVRTAGVPGTSFDARDPESTTQEDKALTQARTAVQQRYTQQLDERGIEHNLHLFLDTVHTPAKAIFDTINGVCKNVDAQMLVMAANHRVSPGPLNVMNACERA